MLTKIKQWNNKHKNIYVELIFLIIAMLFVAYPIYTGHWITCDDAEFNFQRLNEIFKDILHFHYPNFYMYTSLPLGSATSTMYPWLLLAIFTPLFLFLKPIELWCTIVACLLFMGLNVAYFTFNKVMHTRKLMGFTFAILYCLSDIVLSCIYFLCDIGAFSAMMLAPLAIFGWIEFIRHGHWRMMTLGLILMTYCHILTTFVLILTLSILTIVVRYQISKQCKHKITKIIGTYILSTAIVWLPIVYLSIANKIMSPSLGFNSSSAYLFPNWSFLSNPLNMRVWTFVDAIAILFIILNLKHLCLTAREIFYTAIGLIILDDGTIWHILTTIIYPFRYIQFSYRFNYISDFIFIWLFIIILFKVVPETHKDTYKKIIKFSLIFVLLITGESVLVGNNINFNTGEYSKNMNMFLLGQQHSKKYRKLAELDDFNQEHKKLLGQESVTYDYYPVSYYKHKMVWYAMTTSTYHYVKKIHHIHYQDTNEINYHAHIKDIKRIEKHALLSKLVHNKIKGNTLNIIFARHHYLPTKLNQNGVQFKVAHNNENIVPPIMIYQGENYSFKLNHHKITPKTWHTNDIVLKHLHKGTYTLHYRPHIMWFNYVSWLLTLIGLYKLVFHVKHLKN